MALNDEENSGCRKAKHIKIDALEKMDYWDLVDRANDQKVIHNGFVFNEKKDENRNLKQYKARLDVFGNEDTNYHENNFSPVAIFTVAKLMIRIGLQKSWTARHLAFKNAFPNSYLKRVVYTELRRHLYSESDRNEELMKLDRGLYGLKEAAKVCNDLLFKTFREIELKEMK